ncbi:MAG: hypothetical protein JSS28_12515 [Proteobacteria bacterium]|nr:hypothetical protein [Pseudomonadota bacterium]
MNEQPLHFRDIAAQLPASPATHVPPPDLWPRIAATHMSRRRQRRWRRVAASVGIGALAVALALAVTLRQRATTPAIDWQARAQALEMQLDALPLPATSEPMAQLAESELARLDQRLQTAYDRGASRLDLDPLWQRRSELLDALLLVRRQQTLPVRI